MGVDLRRLDARMPEKFLDGVDIRPVHDEVAGERVPHKENIDKFASLNIMTLKK